MSLAKTILDATTEAIKLIGDIVEDGQDPVEEMRRIRRIRKLPPALAEVERDWADAIADKFGPGSERGEQ
jgi:hypothetical protein